MYPRGEREISRANGLIEQDPLAHIVRYLTNSLG